ncbi:hypothetical protein [Actinokineospora inagensis]|uniref:hypothetical protein n=1 Tax=Actinokineospora inagensis TaxID=103730 RepID=UPI0012FA9C7F|nr:hypothetical protein [Actinokineospora inagensis]
MEFLNLSQEELVYRSGVSKNVIRELRRAIIRRRGTRTLEAVSTALGFHPTHLDAIAHNRQPPIPRELATLDPFADNLRLLHNHLEQAAHYITNLINLLDNLIGRPEPTEHDPDRTERPG